MFKNSFMVNGKTFVDIKVIDTKKPAGATDNWCSLSLEVQNDYLNYKIHSETLTVADVKYIREMLLRVIKNEVKEDDEYTTLEPTLTINIYKNSSCYLMLKIDLRTASPSQFGGDYYLIPFTTINEVKRLYECLELIEEN